MLLTNNTHIYLTQGTPYSIIIPESKKGGYKMDNDIKKDLLELLQIAMNDDKVDKIIIHIKPNKKQH